MSEAFWLFRIYSSSSGNHSQVVCQGVGWVLCLKNPIGGFALHNADLTYHDTETTLLFHVLPVEITMTMISREISNFLIPN